MKKLLLLIPMLLWGLFAFSQVTDIFMTGKATEIRLAGPGQNTADRIATFGQYLIDSKVNVSQYAFVTATGTNTYSANIFPAITTYTGLRVWVTFTNANTGASTLNLNVLGAKSIVDESGNPTVLGSIPANSIKQLAYNGTALQMVGGTGTGGGALTNGQGTIGNGTAADLGGTISSLRTINFGTNGLIVESSAAGGATTSYLSVANQSSIPSVNLFTNNGAFGALTYLSSIVLNSSSSSSLVRLRAYNSGGSAAQQFILTDAGIQMDVSGGNDTRGDLYFRNSSNLLGRLSDVATGNAIISGGIAGDPAYGKIGLTTHVSGILPIANGGTATATPALVAGTNVTITGTWPNQTINSTASGGGSNPFDDGTALVKGSVDATKLLRIEVDGFTTGVTRVLTPPNFDGVIATTNNAQTFTGVQTFSSIPIFSAGLGSATATTQPPLTGNTTLSTTAYTDLAILAAGMAAFSTTVPGYVNLSGAAGSIVYGDNTWLAVGASRKMLISNGTRPVYSTETWAVPGTSGNVLTSDGTNWTSTAPASGVSLASQAEVNAGADNTKAVSPLTLLTKLSLNRTVTSAAAIVQSDNQRLIYFNSATPFNFTIDQLTIDTYVNFINVGAGTVTFVNGSGVTYVGASTLVSGGSGVILYRSVTVPVISSGSQSLLLSSIVAATATNTINNATFTQEWQWNTIAGASGLKLTSTSTAAASNAQKILEVLLTGANSTSAQTTYGAYISNAHTGTTSQNVALLLEATGAATANWGFQIQGNDNAALIQQMRNSSSGATASTVLRWGNNTSAFAGQIEINSSGNSAAGGGANSLNILTTSAGGGPLTLGTNSAVRYTISLNGNNTWTQAAQSVTNTLAQFTQAAHTGGVPTVLGVTGGALTAGTAGTEITDVSFNLARIIQHASNTLVALDRSVFIGARTIAFATSGGVVTDAVTLEVSGDPIVGTNVSSFTRVWTARLLGKVAIGTSMYIGSPTGVVAPTALLHLAAGTATASTAPLKFTSGTSLTSAEAGAAEFTTDDLFFTITTGAARKRLLMADPVGGLTSGRVPYVTTNGRVTDATGFTYDGNNVFDLGGATGINITGNNMAIGGANTTGVSNLTLYDGTLAGTVAGFSFNSIAGDPRAVNSNGVAYSIGGSIKDYFTDVNNGTTVETDLYTFTTIASTLSTDGDKLYIKYIGTFNDVTATTQLKIYFGGTAIGDTGALTISATGGWEANATIIRTSSTTVRTSVNISTPGASTALYTKETDVTGLTLSNTNIVKITGTAAGASGGSNDITSKFGSIFFVPAAP